MNAALLRIVNCLALGREPHVLLLTSGKGGKHVVEGADAIGMLQRVGLCSLMAVFGDFHDGEGGGVFPDAVEADFVCQPSIDGLTARLVGSDSAPCVSQRRNRQRGWRWLVEPSPEKSHDHLMMAFVVVGLTMLTGHSSPDRSSPLVSTSCEAGASSQNEVLPGWPQSCIRRSYSASSGADSQPLRSFSTTSVMQTSLMPG